uniref:Guanylate-binding protein 3-like n=1 Tax=Saccoglossus kowalevskii TaxID=10224 RepID=A0ABM0MGU8_SACKO|nr:PREDICTED: guanylate-binding protein 3-like [Saccoglossus kowalevskii]
MVVCDEALSILQSINHPVCVVAVVGDRRTGKSYILSQLQEPRASECVFGISSAMKANTIGIWMNSKPFIKTLHDGTQVAMILLDTEGLGSIETMGEYDHHILTLVVLLSSVLIYNGSGLVKADDLRKLRCVADLATRIQVRTNESESGSSVEFYKFFPNFHWLLRDVLLIPTITRNGVEEEVEIKDYILEEIFKRETTTSAESRRHAGIGNAILRFFPTFNAYSLPLPSLNPQVVKNIEDPKFQDQINPIFLEKVNDFIGSLHGYLKPKKAWPKAGHVTGKQLSELVKVYTAMLAKPGAIPNVQSAWDQILTAQLEASLNKATQLYETNMDIFVCENIPCEEVFIMEKHGVWFDQASKMFYEEVNTINDADLVSKYYRKFQVALQLYK